MKLYNDFLWTKRSPRSIRDGPEESRGIHKGGERAPQGAPPTLSSPRGPPDLFPMPKIPINIETPKKKPRLGVPSPQSSVATKNQSGPCSGTLPEGETITGGHLHCPDGLHDEEGVVHPQG